MLEVRSLNIGYSKDAILVQNAEFQIQRGDFVALIGRNGTGKTTLLKTITGQLKSISGSCKIDGKDIQTLNNRQMSKMVSIVNTERIRLSYLKVEELLALGRFPHTNFMGKLTQEDKAILEQTIDNLDIQALRDKSLSHLSDGELQKVLIGRAIIQDTPFIILDEPTTHLDLINRFQIFKLLQQLCQQQNKTILLSTHEIELAFDLSDRILFLNNEHQLISASTDEFVKSDWIKTSFQSDGVDFDEHSRRFRYS